jgi:hypothetical protein
LCLKFGKSVGRQIVDCSCWFYLVSCFRFFEGRSCLYRRRPVQVRDPTAPRRRVLHFLPKDPFFPFSGCCDLVFIDKFILCFSARNIYICETTSNFSGFIHISNIGCWVSRKRNWKHGNSAFPRIRRNLSVFFA